jgi:hypothetical protein
LVLVSLCLYNAFLSSQCLLLAYLKEHGVAHLRMCTLEMAFLSIHPLVDLLGRKACPLDVRKDPPTRPFRYETTVGSLLVSLLSIKVLKPRSLLSKLKAEANIVLGGNTAKKAVDTHRGGISISCMHTFSFLQFL